jgi:hypothetical protein
LDINTGRAEALRHDCLRHLSRLTFASGIDAVVFGSDAVAFGADNVVFGVDVLAHDFSPALSDCRSAGL